MNLLFSPSFTNNLLPYDGEVFLYENLMKETVVLEYFNQLEKNIAWKQEGMRIYGKQVNFPRLTAWYGDEGKTYKYSGLLNEPLPFTGLLVEIKETVEHLIGEQFNSALLNFYRDGNDSMGWHSDDEPELGINPTIASVSFGETRNFQFKHKKIANTLLNFLLANNSLLVMKGATQHNWKHQVPKRSKLSGARINITFRKIEGS